LSSALAAFVATGTHDPGSHGQGQSLHHQLGAQQHSNQTKHSEQCCPPTNTACCSVSSSGLQLNRLTSWSRLPGSAVPRPYLCVYGEHATQPLAADCSSTNGSFAGLASVANDTASRQEDSGAAAWSDWSRRSRVNGSSWLCHSWRAAHKSEARLSDQHCRGCSGGQQVSNRSGRG